MYPVPEFHLDHAKVVQMDKDGVGATEIARALKQQERRVQGLERCLTALRTASLR